MSETKFTPGPWWLEGKSHVIAFCGDAQIRIFGIDDTISPHNLNLVLNATELYDALEHAAHVLRDVAKTSGLTHSDAESCADTADRILAKARDGS